MNGLFLTFCGLQAADAHLTLRVLRKGGKEENRLMRKLIDKFGTAGLVLPKAAFCAAVWFNLDLMPVWLLGGLDVLYALVCVSNWQELHGKRSLLDRLRDL